MNLPFLKKRTPYERSLWSRKARMYVTWALVTIVSLVVSLTVFDARFFEMLDPQIKRAYVKMNDIVPSFAVSEYSVGVTYDLFKQSRKEVQESGITLSQDYASEDDSPLGRLDGSFTLEWVTQLGVGKRGSVVVVNKSTGEIIADSTGGNTGKTLMVAPLNVNHVVGLNVARYKGFPEVELSKFSSEDAAKDVRLKHMLVYVGDGTSSDIFSSVGGMMYGSIVTYEDMYIVCGIDVWEYLIYMARALYIVAVVSVLMWVFVHYIAMVLDRHEMDDGTLRTRLTACTVIMTIAVFGLSWYVQVLGDITSALHTMQSYAKAGVENIESYVATQERIDDWLDKQYLTQCRIACDYVNSESIENIDRQELAKLSKDLGVKHIYVFDQEGRVIVTNSPYDHFVLSDDPEQPSYAFRSLLEGADHVIMPPAPDEIAGIPTQFIGVSRRNSQDLADGFVQVAIDPELRNYLTSHLTVDSVLANMTVGEPQAALAFDKETLTVIAATDPAYIGEPLESFGYTQEKLKENSSGFFTYDYQAYCVGFAESDNYILVPIMSYPGDTEASSYSLRLSIIVAVGLLVIMVFALYHYQESVLDAAPVADEAGVVKNPKKKSLARRAITAMGLSSVVQAREKTGFEDRWDMVDLHAENTPERNTFIICCRLLLVFCLLHLLPLLYGGLFQDGDGLRLTGLSYVISGRWEKGVNIFAFTSCLILLFALYVFMMISNRILYAIAKVSDLRTETVCLLLRSSLSYFCAVAFIYYGLSEFGIPTQALLASVGIITLAVSVGAKDLVNDIIAGFFILLEGDLKVGDYVTVGSWSGSVQEIGLRTTKILSNKKTKLCNNSSLRDVISCANTVVLKVYVPVSLSVDLAEVEAVLNEELPRIMGDEPNAVTTPVYEGINEYTGTQAILSIRVEVNSDKQTSVRLKFCNRLKKLFDSHGFDQLSNTTVQVFYKEPSELEG